MKESPTIERRRGLGWLLFALLLVPYAPGVRAATDAPIERSSPEYRFFRQQFLRANGAGLSALIDPTFASIQAQVTQIQQKAPGVTLGGMLSLVLFESGERVGFYDTLDKENSFRARLSSVTPYADQPLAHYSYQFGLVPLHTSIFRPCMRGTQENRDLFTQLAMAHGYQPSREDLESVRPQWTQACHESIRGHIEQPGPEPADFFILTCHSKFAVPPNAVRTHNAPIRVDEIQAFPFYSAEITAPIFFRGILKAGSSVNSDRDAIAIWGGGDAHYAQVDRQDRILADWRKFDAKK